jgi:hypothetical protein
MTFRKLKLTLTAGSLGVALAIPSAMSFAMTPDVQEVFGRSSDQPTGHVMHPASPAHVMYVQGRSAPFTIHDGITMTAFDFTLRDGVRVYGDPGVSEIMGRDASPDTQPATWDARPQDPAADDSRG